MVFWTLKNSNVIGYICTIYDVGFPLRVEDTLCLDRRAEKGLSLELSVQYSVICLCIFMLKWPFHTQFPNDGPSVRIVWALLNTCSLLLLLKKCWPNFWSNNCHKLLSARTKFHALVMVLIEEHSHHLHCPNSKKGPLNTRTLHNLNMKKTTVQYFSTWKTVLDQCTINQQYKCNKMIKCRIPIFCIY